ncbi:MAG TPA: hypothetical protein VL442_07225 [Mucilaginibacter sp.]|nr:hypothetical protein [Mucilaginibacter sp.]
MISKMYIDLEACTETPDALICSDIDFTNDIFKHLQEVDRSLRRLNFGEILMTDELGGEIDLSEINKPDNLDKGRFSIQKICSFPIFFTETAWITYLESLSVVGSLYGLFFTKTDFQNKWTIYMGENTLLSGNIPGISIAADADIDVPKLVKSLNSEANNYLPHSSAYWLSPFNASAPIWWKKVSAAKLLTTFGKEFRLSGHLAELTFIGDRRINISLDLNSGQVISSYKSIQFVADWLFQDLKGTETRHTLLNNQVGLLSISDTVLLSSTIAPVADKILAGAKMAYRFYLQDTDKELYKSLTEINKTLFEHVSKIRQNTMDLISGLWRDFTTAFGLLILNFSLKKPDITAIYWNWLLYGLIIYLIVNLALYSNMGFWFYYRLKDSLTDMRIRIYGYLTDEDFNTYATNPLKGAFRKFRRTFVFVAACYIAIIALILLSIYVAPKLH